MFLVKGVCVCVCAFLYLKLGWDKVVDDEGVEPHLPVKLPQVA